jgi:integrase
VSLGVTTPGEVPTLADYVDEWLAGRRQSLRRTTWNSYEDVLHGHVVPRLGALRLDKLTAKHVAELVDELLATGSRDPRRGPGLSARTVRYTLVVLTQALGDAVKRCLIPRNVAALVDKPRVPKPETGGWELDEARAFLSYTADDRLSALWTLLLTTGLRRGEALGLRWDDIDMDGRRLAVRRTLVATNYEIRKSEPKTEAGRRVVALDPATVASLRAHRSRQLENGSLSAPATWTGGSCSATSPASRCTPTPCRNASGFSSGALVCVASGCTTSGTRPPP